MSNNAFPPRVRFNWGFHDAQYDAQERRRVRNMSDHFDKAYAAGYMSGIAEYRQTYQRNESSDPAWKVYQGHLAHARTTVKLMRLAEPLTTRRI